MVGQDTWLVKKGLILVQWVQWRNAEWWEIMKGTGVGSQDHSWRHPKKNWSRGFEHALTKICGLGWWEPARSDWQGKRWEFVCEAVRRWGGPGLGKLKTSLALPIPFADVDLD